MTEQLPIYLVQAREEWQYAYQQYVELINTTAPEQMTRFLEDGQPIIDAERKAMDRYSAAIQKYNEENKNYGH